MNLKEKLRKIEKLEQEIYSYFDFEGDWHVYPIDDCTDEYWMLFPRDGIAHMDEPFTKESIEGNLYTGRALKVFKTTDYTAVVYDTECDRNIFFSIFDNALECKDSTLKHLIEEQY